MGKRDDGKDSGGKPRKKDFSNQELLESIRDPRMQRILSFMRGDPIDDNEARDAREILFASSPKKDPEMK